MGIKKLLFWRNFATKKEIDRLKLAISVLADAVDTQKKLIEKLATDFYTVEKNTGNVPKMDFDAHGDV